MRFVFLLCSLAFCHAYFYPRRMSFRQQVLTNLVLDWDLDHDSQTLILCATSQIDKTNYLALGFGESLSQMMNNTDIVVGFLDTSNSPIIQSMYSNQVQGLPSGVPTLTIYDSQISWNAGSTRLCFRRPFISGHHNVNDRMLVAWAIGPLSNNVISYHTRAESQFVDFLHPPISSYQNFQSLAPWFNLSWSGTSKLLHISATGKGDATNWISVGFGVNNAMQDTDFVIGLMNATTPAIITRYFKDTGGKPVDPSTLVIYDGALFINQGVLRLTFTLKPSSGRHPITNGLKVPIAYGIGPVQNGDVGYHDAGLVNNAVIDFLPPYKFAYFPFSQKLESPGAAKALLEWDLDYSCSILSLCISYPITVTQYIAIGFQDRFNAMQNMDVVYGFINTNSAPVIVSAYSAVPYGIPNYPSKLNITDAQFTWTSSSAKLCFRRPFIGGSHNITDGTYFAWALGPVTNNQIQIHSFHATSNIDFLHPPPSSYINSQVMCPVLKYTVYWSTSPSQEVVHILAVSKKFPGWISLGFGIGQAMSDTDYVIGMVTSNSNLVYVKYLASGYAPPSSDSTLTLLDSNLAVINGTAYMSFTRPYWGGRHPISHNSPNLVAYGVGPVLNNQIMQHETNDKGLASINFLIIGPSFPLYLPFRQQFLGAPVLNIQWDVDGEQQQLTICLEGTTSDTQYIAFGFGTNDNMVDLDLVAGFIDANGQPQVKVMYSNRTMGYPNGIPTLSLISSSFRRTTNTNPPTSRLCFIRPFNSGHHNISDNMATAWAYGNLYNNDIGMHSAAGLAMINFIHPPLQSYQFSSDLSSSYGFKVYWGPSPSRQRLFMCGQYIAANTNWVSLGFGVNNKMANTDFVIGSQIGGTNKVRTLYTDFPNVCPNSNSTLSISNASLTYNDNSATLCFTRTWQSGKQYIQPDNVAFLAWGRGPASPDGTLQYHGPSVGIAPLVLAPTMPPSPPTPSPSPQPSPTPSPSPPTPGGNSVQFQPDFTLSWTKTQGSQKTVTFLFTMTLSYDSSSPQYASFGIPRDLAIGQMTNADVILVYMTGDSKCDLRDSFAVGNYLPPVDKGLYAGCTNDLTLLSCSYTNGKMEVKFSRLQNTGDKNCDSVIEDKAAPLMFARGYVTDSVSNGPSFVKHFAAGFTSPINLMTGDVENNSVKWPYHYVSTIIALLIVCLVGWAGQQSKLINSILIYRPIPPPSSSLLQKWAWPGVFDLTISEIGILILFGGVLFAWFATTWLYVNLSFLSIYKFLSNITNITLARIMGNINMFLIATTFIPVTRHSLWFTLIGIPLDRAIKFHRWCARITFVAVTLHGALMLAEYGWKYTTTWSEGHLAGILSWVSMLLMVILALSTIRRKFWEIFYYSHLLFFVLVLVFAFLHLETRPTNNDGNLRAKFAIYLALPGLLYVADLLMRLRDYFRTAQVTKIHSGTLEEITHLQIRIPGFTYESGQYILLNIPSVSLNEWHPFSLCCSPNEPQETTDTVNLYIKNMGTGTWTGKLQSLALQYSDGRTRSTGQVQNEKERELLLPTIMVAHIEGPFGKPNLDIMKYEATVFVAGGVGVTALYGHIFDLYKHRQEMIAVHFIWVIRKRMSWMSEQIHTSIADLASRWPALKLTIYVTEDQGAGTELHMGIGFKIGRPDFQNVFNELESSLTDKLDTLRIGVLCCGPDSMVNSVQRNVWSRNNSRISYDLHKEYFTL